MNAAELNERLHRASSCDAWLTVLSEYFASHPLTYGHGTDNPGDEAYWLLKHMHGWRDDVWDAPPDPSLAPALAELAVRRVQERVPMGYLLGESWFAGLRFSIDERALIPRSPLAELIERQFAPWIELAPGDRLLDVGTGSGCLAIAAAHHCTGLLVDATDSSGEALELARENLAMHGLEDRVELFEADLFPRFDRRYRVIMSNPPYVPDGEVATLPREYQHEPAAALAGGPTGLDPVHRLLAGARSRLEPEGLLIVEVGNEAAALEAAYPTLPFVWLEFERGGEGVFVLSARDLSQGSDDGR